MSDPYVQVPWTPYAVPMALVALIGRLPLSMVGLGSVLLVASRTGSYGLGGAVAAVGAVTTAIAGPVIGRLADSLGQRRVLLFVVGAATGSVLGTLEISLVAYADHAGHEALSGVLALLTVLTLPLVLIGSVWLLPPFVVPSGVTVSPSLISSFTLAARRTTR